MSLRIFKYFFRCRCPMILFLISIATASSSAFLLCSTMYSNLSFIKTCCKGQKWKVNHCGYLKFTWKLNLLEECILVTKRTNLGRFSSFFFLSLISFTLSARDFLCAVFGFGTSLYSDPPEKLFPAVSSACGRPRSIIVTLNRCTQEKTSGTQSSLASLLKVMLHGTIGNDVFSTTKCWNVGTIL